jgi:hypothetical protein
MSIEQIDSRVNAASLRVFGEAATFEQGGNARVIFTDQRSAVMLGLAPADAPAPVISLTMTELQRLGAQEGSTVVVRGILYTLMEGGSDAVADAGGMAHLRIRQYA